MIGFRALSALALACAASAVACSSSSGGSGGGGGTPTKFACATDNTMMTSTDQSCISCVESNCGSEFSAAYGSGYASMNFSGGACGSFITCIAGCACNDIACEETCVGDGGAVSGPCETAETNAESCEQQKCASQCVTSSPGDDGGGGGTADFDASAIDNSVCIIDNGSTCPTANLVGCCKIAGGSSAPAIETCFYPPVTASDVMQECSAEGGSFSTGQ
jgi:hypothetical protein